MGMRKRIISQEKHLWAYFIGLALGDGNLSNPNNRAVRIRITCDKKYPKLSDHIRETLEKLLPENIVSVANREGCVDISAYSNYLPEVLGWEPGAKYLQAVRVPGWIKQEQEFMIECLRGLFQTDGSIYKDRKYTMVNFVSYIPSLAKDVFEGINELGFKANMQKLSMPNGKIKYTIRIAKDSLNFINKINLWKA